MVSVIECKKDCNSLVNSMKHVLPSERSSRYFKYSIVPQAGVIIRINSYPNDIHKFWVIVNNAPAL